ncbi:DUF806 family protein [Limosilactobacillus pontis]|uniref:DUF806 family protein n=1 Tax=Limosilactobacillus pontis TaxID=35787 RepID=UPI002F260921
MLATKRAKVLIQSAHFEILNEIYTYNIPSNEDNNADKTVCLITDVRTDPALPGNEDFHAFNKEVEVQAFYGLNAPDPDEFESQLQHLFIKDGWVVLDNRGHTFDPDTNQLTATFYFDYFEIEDAK